MNSFLNELIEIQEMREDISSRYQALSAIYHRFINSATANVSVGIELRGPFAKTDYLLKEHGASTRLTRITHTARSHFKTLSSLSDEEKEYFYPYDLEALARFFALVEKADIPTALSSRFPSPMETKRRGILAADSMRLIVEDFDLQFIRAKAESDPVIIYQIDYATPSEAYPFDRSYLHDILFPGAQINAIRPRIDGTTIFPEILIFEPDILIDVSTVAGCFESYATDPRIALLKRITPPPAGDAINLGNFAGQLLDEAIHATLSPRPYPESAMDFFRNNALALAAIPPGRSFHADAGTQRNNIFKALHRDLPESFSGFDIKEVMVEPSFFSEMLGLQGRMDFLQLDMRILVEQKSGKGEWPYNNFIVPRQRTSHYVQLLLYMLIIRYNYRSRYEANGRKLDPFLLYSKYEKSLLALGFAPALVEEAIKIRNMIAARDILYAEQGMDFLKDLTPAMLNTKGESKLWKDYTAPQLSSLLSPIRAVEETDRKYYLRFMRFVAKEHLLAKTGNRKKENSGFASTWLSPPEEKIESGNIYVGLHLDLPAENEEGINQTGKPGKVMKIEDLTLRFTEDDRNGMANFRKGDIVILYSYPEGSVPDARRNMVFRCSIADITSRSIRLRLRAPQSSVKAFFNRLDDTGGELLWAIEHDFVESSFTGLYRAVHSFLSAPSSRRDLLMMRRSPSIDTSRKLRLDHGSFNSLALKAKQAGDMFLIIGPPGTGKTSFGLMTSLREELAEPESNVLISAFTNRAVDEICSKLASDGIDYIRLGSELSCSSPKENLLCNRIASCRTVDEVRQVIVNTRVIVATTTALNSSPLLFKLKNFSLAIIDEASQILEPHIIGLLSAVSPRDMPAIGRFIMIGDHKQLPAIVQQTPADSRVDEPELHAIGLTDCALSLFERLVRHYGNNPSVCHMLTSQGRMHEEIARFPNDFFYGGNLNAVPLPHQVASLPEIHTDGENKIGEILRSRRIAFFNIPLQKREVSDKVNHNEAKLISLLVKEIYEIKKDTFDPDRTVGIIVPYRNQIAAIRNELTHHNIPELTDITIDTIERYQGSQRKFIIYGFTVSRPYQLDFLSNQTFREDEMIIDRKLNVAMTRAEEHLLMVGNAPLLRRNVIFSNLLDYLTRENAVFSSLTDPEE